MPNKIQTDYWPKPIPQRYFDWCAYRDDYEPGRPIGYGATELSAIKDLFELEADRKVDRGPTETENEEN